MLIRVIEFTVPKLVALVLAATVGILFDGLLHSIGFYGIHRLTNHFFTDWLVLTFAVFVGLLWADRMKHERKS